MTEGLLTYIARAEDDGQRLDKVLAVHAQDLSRSRLKALILDSAVLINEKICTDPSAKIREQDVLSVDVPAPVDDTPLAEDIALDIVYEDDALLIINKNAGLVVHPGAGNQTGTLVNALLHHCGDSLSGIGGVKRPGIVHRLDKDTSGLMVAAKSDKAHKGLSAQLSDRSLHRRYKAFVWGVPEIIKGSVNEPIGRHPSHRLKMAINHKNGRQALTHYSLDKKFGSAASILDCQLESGRTHQVRVHMAHIKYPLIGDPLYGLQDNAGRSRLAKQGYDEDAASQIMDFPRQALHAWKIGFIHPLSGEALSFEAPLPEDMKTLLSLLDTAN